MYPRPRRKRYHAHMTDAEFDAYADAVLEMAGSAEVIECFEEKILELSAELAEIEVCRAHVLARVAELPVGDLATHSLLIAEDELDGRRDAALREKRRWLAYLPDRAHFETTPDLERARSVPLEAAFSHLGLSPASATQARLSYACPLHSEKTASLVVYVADNHYHCFGCGAHGDAITLFRELRDLSFRDAVAELCQVS